MSAEAMIKGLMGQANAGGVVSMADLAALNDTLQKSTVGYQDPSGLVGAAAGVLSALVPQSLENTLASATFKNEHIVLWKAIAKMKVGQTVHEYNRLLEHGRNLSPYMAEGGLPAINRSTYERKMVKVKYLAEHREISDVAATINPLVGPSKNAIVEETTRGMTNLLGKIEDQLWHGNEAANPLAFDGLIRQISAESESVYDLRGAKLEAGLIQDQLGELCAAPFYGTPDCVYVEPRVHQSLIKSTVDRGRHDQLSVSQDSSTYTFGVKNIEMMGPLGAVKVKAAPFLHNAASPADTASHLVATPTIKAIAYPADATALFAADKTYLYKIVAVSNEGGESAPVTSAVADVNAGQNISITMNVSPKSDFYRVYRSQSGPAAGVPASPIYKFIGSFRNTDPGVSEDAFVDKNAVLPGTSSAVILKHDPEYMQVIRLLDLLKRPLAEVKTTRPFLLMCFMTLVVKQPQKMRVITNIGL